MHGNVLPSDSLKSQLTDGAMQVLFHQLTLGQDPNEMKGHYILYHHHDPNFFEDYLLSLQQLQEEPILFTVFERCFFFFDR